MRRWRDFNYLDSGGHHPQNLAFLRGPDKPRNDKEKTLLSALFIAAERSADGCTLYRWLSRPPRPSGHPSTGGELAAFLSRAKFSSCGGVPRSGEVVFYLARGARTIMCAARSIITWIPVSSTGMTDSLSTILGN